MERWRYKRMRLFLLLLFWLPIKIATSQELLQAVYENDHNQVLSLLKNKPKIDEVHPYGVTALSLACELGHSEIALALIKAKADPNLEALKGEAPIMLAARSGKLELVEALINAKAKVNVKNEQGQTAIMWAANEGHALVVRALAKAGADVNLKSKTGFFPLLYAARNGHLEVCKTLIKEKADLHAQMGNQSKGRMKVRPGTTAYIIAIENAHYELALKLLDLGAEVNELHSGLGALHIVSRNRRPDRGDGRLGLPTPPGSGKISSLEFVKQLLQNHKAEVNLQLATAVSGDSKLAKKGATPLLLAAQRTDLDYMKLLHSFGADLNLSNINQTTPLLAAAGLGCTNSTEEAATEPEAIACIDWLLSFGQDINQINKRQDSVMHAASLKNFPKLIHHLVDRGADISIWNHKNKNGNTPLLIAQGFRPGNFKPDQATIDALSSIMLKAGIQPPPAPLGKKKKY